MQPQTPADVSANATAAASARCDGSERCSRSRPGVSVGFAECPTTSFLCPSMLMASLTPLPPSSQAR